MFKYLAGDNCSNIQDLATLTSPYNATTTGYTANDISGMACTAADNGSASRIFSIVVNDGEELHIGQSSNTFDSRHSLAYGGSCPGDSLLACVDDPDTQEEVWTNNTGSTQTVYFIVAGYSSTSQGDFVLDWHVVTCPDPSNLGIDNLTDASVDLTWTAVNATTWDIELDTAGFTPTGIPTYDDVTSNPFNVTGLTPETSYDFYVREVCSATDTSNWVGPFQFTTTESCPTPTDLSATNISATSADITWNGYFASNWDVLFGLAGFDTTGMAISANDISANPYTIDTLTANTQYEYYVRADCGQDNIDTSHWVGPYLFETLCETPPTVSTFPWISDFDNGDECDFVVVDSLGGGAKWHIDAISNIPSGDFSNNGNSSLKCLLADGSAANGINTTAFSPALDLTTVPLTAIVELKFESQFQDYAGNGDAYVFVSDDNMATWTQIFTVTNDEQTGGEIHSIDLSSYIGSTINIAWQYVATSGDAWQWAIDNIDLSVITCPAPTQLTASNITENTATLSWITGGSSDFNLVYGPVGFNMQDSTIIEVTDTSYNVTGLNPSSNFEFYVRDSCGVGDVSTWSGPYMFSTLCGTVIAPFYQNFDISTSTPNCWDNTTNSALVWNFGNSTPSTGTGPQNGDHTTGSGNFAFIETSSGNLGDSAFLSTPIINIDGLTIPAVEFYYNMYGASINTITVQLYNGTWNDIFTLSGEQDMDWHRALIDISAYSGDIQIRFIGIRGNDYTGDISIDDVAVKEGPSCWFPTNLGVDNLTNNSVDLVWTTGGASTWNVLFGLAGFDTTGLGPLAADITTNPLTVDTLTAETTYEYYVRDVCSSTDSSEWVGPFQFTTLESCPTPTDLDVTNITTTSADLSWNGYFATTWDVEFGEAGFAPTGTPNYDNVTNSTLTIDTLTTATSYDFYVRADCGTDSSVWVGPFTFTSECDVISLFPYYEDFENAGDMPVCWSQEYDNGTHDWIYIDGDNSTLTAYQGSYNAAFKHVSSGDITKLITPTFDLTSLTTPRIVFAHAQANWAGDQDSLKLYYRGTSNDPWTLIPGAVWTDDIQTWTVESIVLPNPTSTYQIAFEGIDQYGYGVVIDSVVVGESGDIDLAVTTPADGIAYSSCVYTGQDTIPFAVTNNGDNIEPAGSTINAWYEYDGNVAVAETFVLANDLNPTETATFFFAQTVDFTGGTAHNVKVYIDYNGDINANNDTTNSTFTMQDPIISINQGDTMYVASGDFPKVLSVGNTFESYFWYNEDSTVTGTNVQLIINDYGTYIVNATDANGCVASDTIYVLMLTNISSVENMNISVYPNPNNGEFTLYANFKSAIDFTVEMVNVNGEIIYTNKFNGVETLNENIDVDNYAKGIYYIRISNKSFIKQEKVVIY